MKMQKLSAHGIGHIMVIAALFVAVAVLGSGFLVYKHQHKARAAGYTYIGSRDGITAYACSVYNAAYGGIYNIRYLLTKPTYVNNYHYTAEVFRKGKLISQNGASAWFNGTVATATTTASAQYSDTTAIELAYGFNQFSFSAYPWMLDHC